MTPVTNNKDLRDEENNHHHGHEIILHSMPNENEMATNHPEDDEEEEEFEDEMEMHPDAGNTNLWCPGWSRSRALTALLATAGGGAVVGGGSVVFRAARGKPSISSSMQQVVALALDNYEYVGPDGECLGVNLGIYYSSVRYDDAITADACATKCEECVEPVLSLAGFQLGAYAVGDDSSCYCNVEGLTTDSDFTQFQTGECAADDTWSSSFFLGPITQTDDCAADYGCTFSCYKWVGGGSKSGKTKRSKAPKSTN